MSEEELENIKSQFLINSWSFSAVSTFSRHEKAFEQQYIYGYQIKNSSTTVAGTAYHNALQFYFQSLKEGNIMDLADLEAVAFDTIDETPANKWKIQKTTPTVAECKIKACKTVTNLLKFFIKEVGVYTDQIEEILDVEVFGSEYITINGVELPLPCNFKIDLVVKLKSGKIAVIDHKSKNTFSSEEEMKLFIGRQAITYTNCYESKTGIAVDEVWFVENKYSENRDKSNQLNCFKIELDKDNRRLYEALLYEPLKRMLEAVNDPDYVYMINDSDNLVDSAEIYEFWAKTLIAEVEDFNIEESKKELISKRLKKIRDASIGSINPKIIKQFKENASQFIQYDLSNKNMSDEEKIEHVLRTFGSPVQVEKKFDGYSSNTYLLAVSGGVKIASIQSHKLDLASALNVSNVRVSKDLVVYEGKAYLAVELSKKRERDLLFTKKDLVSTKIPIGKNNFEEIIYWDYNNPSTPHVVICGGSGSGKSVEIKSMIEYGLLSGVEQIEILDLKNEFKDLKVNKKVSVYRDIDNIEKRAEELVCLMNERIKNGVSKPTFVIVEEFADAYLMMSKGKKLDIIEEVQDGFYAPKKMKGPFGDYMSEPLPKMKMKATGRKNTLEENIQSLLQKGRSSGFHLIMATQRADAKTISGSAKVNLTVQICFRVQKEIDSKVVLDEGGAESLAGAGDGLIRSPEYPELVRFQAYFKA